MCSARTKPVRGLVWMLIGLLSWQTGTWAQEEEPDRTGLRLAFPALALAPERAIATRQGGPPENAKRSGAASRAPEAAAKSRLSSRLYLSAGLAVTSGLAAWWSKERADRAYERYLRSASLRRQERGFDRAEQYDRLAGLSFAGMEVGLVLTAYLLFFGTAD